jgi:SAM-dependent methyltransferase
MKEKFKQEIESFQNIWHGGYFGENTIARNQLGLEYYLVNNIENNLTILEIGCGRGRWSKFIYENLSPKKLQCIDVLSEEHNKFWSFVGEEKKEKLEYYQVKDFSLSEIPDDSLDFVFSYDVWCHISSSSQELYLESLYKKCRTGAKLIIMYSDPEKYYNSEPNNLWFIKAYLPKEKTENITNKEEIFKLAIEDSDGEIIEGRWYWIGKEKFLKNINKHNYKVLFEDLEIDKTNVITFFEKNKI